MTASPPVSTLTPARCEACEEVQKAYLEFEISDEGATFALRNPDYEIAKHHALLAAAKDAADKWAGLAGQQQVRAETAEASLASANEKLAVERGKWVAKEYPPSNIRSLTKLDMARIIAEQGRIIHTLNERNDRADGCAENLQRMVGEAKDLFDVLLRYGLQPKVRGAISDFMERASLKSKSSDGSNVDSVIRGTATPPILQEAVSQDPTKGKDGSGPVRTQSGADTSAGARLSASPTSAPSPSEGYDPHESSAAKAGVAAEDPIRKTLLGRAGP